MPQRKTKSLKLNMILNAIKGLMGIIFPLISFPYVSKVLGVDNMGHYNFANSIISYIVLVAGLGINTYAVREGASIKENKLKFEKFADQLFSINIISTMIAYIILTVLLWTVPKFQEYMGLMIILSLQVIFRTIGIEWIYSIYEDYAYITIRSILFQVFSLISLFVLVNDENDVNMYAAITVISCAGSNIFNFFHAHKYCKVKLTNRLDWEKHLKPIMILFAMSVTVTIYVSSDITILGFLCDDYTVGIYSVSTKIYTIIKTILSSILVVSIPRLSAILGEKDMDSFNFAATDIYNTLLTIVIPAIVGIIAFRKQIVILISDVKFNAAVSSLSILSVALFFCLGAWFWGQCILVPLKKESIVFKATVVSAIINIILNFIMIPLWKENAAALTTVLAEGLSFFWCMYEGKKYTQLKGIRSVLIKVIVGCLGIIIVANVLGQIHINLLPKTILITCISIAIYFEIEVILNNTTVPNIFKMHRKRRKKN